MVPGAGVLVFPGLIKKFRTEDSPTTQRGTQTNAIPTKQSYAKAKTRNVVKMTNYSLMVVTSWGLEESDRECGVEICSPVDAFDGVPVPKARKVALIPVPSTSLYCII